MHIRYIFENRETGQNLAEQRRFGKERHSFSPFLHFVACALRRGEGSKFALALGIALAFLSLALPDAGAQALPDAGAQALTERNSDQDFNTLGIAGGNKGPQGLWSDGTTMLVSDVDGKIYSYDLASTERQDSHHRVADDFVLNKDGSTTETIRPYGLWFDTRNNNRTNTLWVASTEGSGANKTAKLYAYKTWWVTDDVREDVPGDETYLMGTRFTETNENDETTYPQDITLEKLTEAPELNTVGNPVVFEVVDGETTTNKFQYEYALDEKKYYMTDSAGNRLEYDGQGNLRSLDADGNPTGRSYTTSTNMVRGPIGNLSPTGIWSDGTTMWVADQGDTIEIDGEKFTSPDRIYAYNLWTNALGEIWTSDMEESAKMFDGKRVKDKEFRLSHVRKQHLPDDHPPEKNTYAQGIWSDGETMWVANTRGAAKSAEKRIYAYNMTTKLRDPDKDFKTLKEADNHRPRGIWSNGETMWVADQTDNKLYAYHAFSQFASRNDKQDFKDDDDRSTLIAAGNNKPRGIWSDDETLWVVDAAKRKLFAYNLATKERDSAKDFNTLDAENDHPTGVWANETTMWVADYDDDKLYAYNMSDKTRDVDNDFNTLAAAGNNQPIGIWSDGTTMWVADTEDDKVYAYKISDKSRDSTKDINVKFLIGDDYNPYPQGIWSDGTTIWVADFSSGNSKIHAFTLPSTGTAAARDEDKDFDKLKDAGNHTPRGIWSDGITMWVADSEKDQIFAYRLSDKAVLVELELTWRNLLTRRHESESFKVQLNPSFLRGTTRYEASIPYSTTNLTLSTTILRPTDIQSVSLHSKTNLLQDADSTTPGFQINNLAVGANLVSITVANADTNTTSLPRTRTYTVDVNREFFTYNDPTKDVDLNLASTNSIIQGIWANETIIWAVDSGRVYQVENGQTNQYKKILAYDRKTNLRIESQDFNLNSTNHFAPRGIWSDGATMWVADSDDNKLYAYKMFDKSRDTTEDFDLDTSNRNPKWIWSDGVTMWVTDEDKVFAYKMSNKTRDESKEYDFDANAENITGIWADGATIWVANSDTNNPKIYAYKLADIDCREEGKDFNTLTLAGNNNPAGIYSDGTTMWVVDSETKKLHAYNQPLSGNASLKSLSLSGVYYNDKDFSKEFASDTTDYTGARVVYSAASTTVDAKAQDPNAFVAIESSSETADADPNTPGHQVTLKSGENEIKIIVTAENGDVKQYKITIARYPERRLPFKDFQLTDDNSNPTGLWSNGTNMWVLDSGMNNKKFYVYKMTDDEWSEREESKEFRLTTQNSDPGDIWSDGTTMWVPNRGYNKIFAYNLNTNANHYDSPKNFNTLTNIPSVKDLREPQPRGIWSHGMTMWIVYDNDFAPDNKTKIFAFDISNKTLDSDKDITLDGNNTNPWGIYSNRTNMWVLDWNNVGDNHPKLFAYNMWTTNSTGQTIFDGSHDPDKDINLDNNNTNPRGIWSDGKTIWVTDSGSDKIYAYNLLPPPPPPSEVSNNSGDSEDSTLSDLRLSGIELSPVFFPDRRIYTVLVDHTVSVTTVTAVPNDSNATVNIYWGGPSSTRSTASKGPQVALNERHNVIAIDVTADNGSGQTYIVEVTKSEAPPVSGGPLPQNFQPSAVSGASQSDLASSSSGGGWRSRLISAETLPGGEVRFVFLVVSAEEFRLETSSSLISGNWRPLPETEFQATRESRGGQDRLTIILPQAEGKQRFLKLLPLR